MSNLHGTAVTVGHLPCSALEAWRKVCFYEHIQKQPSWFLRHVLPVPQRTTGCYGKVGDSSRCSYSDGGYLAKRISKLIEGERVEFDVIEHSIRYCNSIALKGGVINIDSHSDGTSSVSMLTRYELRSPWLRLFRYFIELTISTMHRVVIDDMRERYAAQQQDSRSTSAGRNRAQSRWLRSGTS